MRNIMIFSVYVLIPCLSFGRVSVSALYFGFGCNQTSYLIKPSQNTYAVGSDIYVKVQSNNPSNVSFVDLYLGKQFIRRDNTHPYEWCKPNDALDPELRNMSRGTYEITVIIRDICGKKRSISRKINIGGPQTFQYNTNSIYSLVWLRNLRQLHPDWKISECTKGGQRYFKMHPCRVSSSYIYWYNQEGTLVAKFHGRSHSQGQFSSARLVKCWEDPCS